jgi:hypothetical protein
MTVENKQERRNGYTRSFYRYVPDLPTRVEPSGQQAFL